MRIEQTRRRLARLRVGAGRPDHPARGRTHPGLVPDLVRRATRLRVARDARTPAFQDRLRPDSRGLKVGHALTVTETALAFLEDARRRGDVCEPLDWIPEVHHPTGSGEAVIPDALLYYRHGPADGAGGAMLRAFVEVDRATMGPERLAAKLTAYERLYRYVPVIPGRRQTLQEPAVEEWRRRYPLFPRLLFVLDGTGHTGIANRISALHAGAGLLAPSRFVYDVPVLAVPLADLLQHGASAPVWRPAHDPGRRVGWMESGHRGT